MSNEALETLGVLILLSVCILCYSLFCLKESKHEKELRSFRDKLLSTLIYIEDDFHNLNENLSNLIERRSNDG